MSLVYSGQSDCVSLAYGIFGTHVLTSGLSDVT